MATALAIACPCAWALATPTAFAASIGSLAKRGILVRGGIPLETSAKASFMVLDKTGTLTLAQPEVEEIIPIKLPKEEILRIIASVESRFNHPLANAIVDYAIEHNVSVLAIEKAESLPGLGVQALVEGREVILGSDYTLKDLGLVVPANINHTGRMIWIVVDRDVVGGVVIQDRLREYATGLAEELRPLGIKRIVLATGDNEEGEARRVAEAIGVQEY
jgi:P-type E1-E2 ATPase